MFLESEKLPISFCAKVTLYLIFQLSLVTASFSIREELFRSLFQPLKIIYFWKMSSLQGNLRFCSTYELRINAYGMKLVFCFL